MKVILPYIAFAQCGILLVLGRSFDDPFKAYLHALGQLEHKTSSENAYTDSQEVKLALQRNRIDLHLYDSSTSSIHTSFCEKYGLQCYARIEVERIAEGGFQVRKTGSALTNIISFMEGESAELRYRIGDGYQIGPPLQFTPNLPRDFWDVMDSLQDLLVYMREDGVAPCAIYPLDGVSTSLKNSMGVVVNGAQLQCKLIRFEHNQGFNVIRTRGGERKEEGFSAVLLPNEINILRLVNHLHWNAAPILYQHFRDPIQGTSQPRALLFMEDLSRKDGWAPLHEVLHSGSSEQQQHEGDTVQYSQLSPQRIKIALGILRLAGILKHHGICHTELTSSNILVNTKDPDSPLIRIVNFKHATSDCFHQKVPIFGSSILDAFGETNGEKMQVVDAATLHDWVVAHTLLEVLQNDFDLAGIDCDFEDRLVNWRSEYDNQDAATSPDVLQALLHTQASLPTSPQRMNTAPNWRDLRPMDPSSLVTIAYIKDSEPGEHHHLTVSRTNFERVVDACRTIARRKIMGDYLESVKSLILSLEGTARNNVLESLPHGEDAWDSLILYIIHSLDLTRSKHENWFGQETREQLETIWADWVGKGMVEADVARSNVHYM